MKAIEQEGKTTNEAIEKALDKLGITKEEARIEILDEGNKGLFGLVGSKPAKVKVTVEKRINKAALEIVNKILFLMKIEAKAAIKNGKDSTVINIESSDSRILIGKRGQTLNSLQYLVNLLINKDNENQVWGRVVIDTENYRDRRENTLSTLANRIADKVDRTKREFRLEPMSSQERRIIHATLQDHKYVITKSIGEGINRRVVIVPK
ncbi:MAG: RNA-binding cell elongation regulator Jag/EloR [bacterium]|nr:RNA-binding cell elongation regulator Jag/EloR [bacterium]